MMGCAEKAVYGCPVYDSSEALLNQLFCDGVSRHRYER